MEGTKKLNILLITNRDSDNCGDQVIEACDIALLSVIMRQIGFSETDFKISSRALAIVSNEFVAAQNEKLLEGAREAIKSADCVIFGGAPVFNYKYQSFYFKTSTIINLAKQYAKPIIFSAIGIDGYDDNSNKCQMIKDALRAGTVKQITTRDGITFLRKYTNEIDIPIHLVADPAVFAVSVYSDVVNKLKLKYDVGLILPYPRIFENNGIHFIEKEQDILLRDTISLLQTNNLSFRVFSSGHCSDELRVQSFADKYKIEGKYVCSATCCPEDLIEEVGSCRAIISFRLHPSIIAFSLNVPSIGIVWNSKVCDFYNAIGYKDRCFEVNEKLTAENIVDAVKSAITEGVKKDEIYLMSVYSTLLSALVQVFNIQSVQPLSYEELCEQLSGLHPKLTISRYRSRVATKTRRLYRHFTKRPGDFRELIRDSDEQIFSSKEIGKR